jgi:hypothetical protein
MNRLVNTNYYKNNKFFAFNPTLTEGADNKMASFNSTQEFDTKILDSKAFDSPIVR